MTDTVAPAPGHPKPARSSRLAAITRPFRDHPILSALVSGTIFMCGAAVSSVVGSVIEQQMNSDAIAAAEIHQQQITDGTRRIEERVASMQSSLQALQSDSNPADAQAFQQEAERLLKELSEVAPIIENAALSNADLVARLRTEALSRPNGATTTAAFELPMNGSATICRDFTVGIRPTADNQVALTISRRGESRTNQTAKSGDTQALTQSDASASATVAGFGRGANGTLVGIDYNCFEGAG